MNDKRIAITGATGLLGSRILRRLAEASLPVRIIVRDAMRAPDLSGIEVREARYQDTGSFARAVEGADTVFLVSLPESAERMAYHRSAVEACRKAGVKRIVYTSFVNARPDATFTLVRDHYDTEQALEASGIPFVALRNNFYTEMLPLLVTNGIIHGPGGNGKLAPVARTDVAAVAAELLMSDSDKTQRLDVTGPELIDLHEIAQMLTEITGDPVRYEEETIEEAYRSRAHFDVEPFELEAWISSYSAIAKGEMAVVSDTVERITGHPALAPTGYLRQILSDGSSRTDGC